MNKEYKIGEVFDFRGAKIQVTDNPDKKQRSPCVSCFFYNIGCTKIKHITGECEPTEREDGKNIIFKEIK